MDSFMSDSSQAKVSFEQIFAVVRLSHKYQVDDIFQQAMTHLKRYCTTRPDHSMGRKLFTSTQAIGAVYLAILTDTPVILPSALLHCASLGSSVLDGWTREDGSVEYLSPGYLRVIMDARDRLIMESFYGLRQVFGVSPSIYCGDPDVCKNRLHELLLEGMDIGNEAFEPKGIFSSWEFLVDNEDGESLCSACDEDIRNYHETVLSDLWYRLPKFFQLNIPGWPRL